ncbi:DEAD/DEAH box helicase [Caldinitratiruptor microaerophilus]|uniref:ATP-dependent RNA helicase CshA n=1 Tax=Caldinitratiruptor microaerophilus TaxID=671077 RepID=A0AA35CJY5_9FIRM|nr:DEAD/DEAH box helicase [Caldinitratiruptor microaerophilus]BDG60502.1 RNA helicase [Caldinitratiruptor microaerophilus]
MDQATSYEKTSFQDLGISDRVLRALAEMGFEEPSPIQARAIPLLLAGKDLIGQAQTGTGKTATFGVPIVEKIDPRVRATQALVLTPTRELAIQVAEEIGRIGRFSRVRVGPIYGGQSIERQVRLLRAGLEVVVGTPGRIMDHMRRGVLSLDRLRILVLDEADEMLDMGFIEDIEWIIQQAPQDRQTMLFSATMPEEIRRLAQRYMRDPEFVQVSPQQLTVPQIEQFFYEVRQALKTEALTRILDAENVERAIIFCRTKKGVDELTEALQGRGYLAEGIHGDMNQAQRNRVMERFRGGQVELLVATDVAARGLDIEGVTHVINYDIPQDPESYVHRIGRTGRAGRSGTAITLITSREFPQLRLIERGIRQRIQRRPLPSLADIAERQRETLKSRVLKALEEGHLGYFREVARDLLQEDYAAEELLAAALKVAAGDQAPPAPLPTDFGETGAEPGFVRFFINIGRAQGVQPADIVRSIAGQAGIPGHVIGTIDIYDRFTFVEVPKEVAGQVMAAMQESTIKGRTINIEPARKR